MTSKNKSLSRSLSPLMRQHQEIKEKYPGTILLFRVGDFYECFGEDAHIISKVLGIVLTKRNNGNNYTNLAGFPYHALDRYMPKLIRNGYRVAVCEQKETPEEAKKAKKKVVEREVIEVSSPGVTFSNAILEHHKNNYIASIYHAQQEELGIAFADVSTGEFCVFTTTYNELKESLNIIRPSEILLSNKLKDKLSFFDIQCLTTLDDWIWEGDYCYRLLTDHFSVHSLKGFGIESYPLTHYAAGALLHYVKENQRSSLSQIKTIAYFNKSKYIELDEVTQRNLELIQTIYNETREGTLFSILDKTCTAMGARLLRKWLLRPLRNITAIKKRLSIVKTWYEHNEIRENIQNDLKQIDDIERIMTRICIGRTTPKEIYGLYLSLKQIGELKKKLLLCDEQIFQEIANAIRVIPTLQEKIHRVIIDDPPNAYRDERFIKEGYHKELDDLRVLVKDHKQYMAKIWTETSKRTGISSLKLGYNKIYGYYFEVTHTHKNAIPSDFIRKQTLVNAERYITPELKSAEEKVLWAEERIKKLEQELFEDLRIFVSEYTNQVQKLSQIIAKIDCLQNFAEVAIKYNYNHPKIIDKPLINIKQGRHPVIEQNLDIGEEFTPNDTYLDQDKQQIIVVTGPNMAGKSVILRQTGLIVLLAHVGSYIPAKDAEIGIVDKIFTRAGASDNMLAGESTFLVEMNETANIMNNVTPRSLVLMDEIGRGTSTFDGICIAWSILEYLHNHEKHRAMTLFSTHYHELNMLEKIYPRIVNYTVKVQEHDKELLFLHQFCKGGTDHSYGIYVAKMAGVPNSVLERAKYILEELEQNADDLYSHLLDNNIENKAKIKHNITNAVLSSLKRHKPQTELTFNKPTIDPAVQKIMDKIKSMDVNSMTPVECMMALLNYKKILNE